MTEQTIVDSLLDGVGDQLRVVGVYEADAWRVEYMRQDVADAYDEAEMDAIANELVLDGLDATHLEQLFDLGGLRASVRLFDEGFVVHVPTDEQHGYLVSLDDGADVKGRDVVSLVRRRVA